MIFTCAIRAPRLAACFEWPPGASLPVLAGLPTSERVRDAPRGFFIGEMMNALIATSNTLTMSSLEIAQLVDQRHDNVKRTITSLGERGVIRLPQFEEVENTGPGPKYIFVLKLDKRSSLIAVAQLCPEFTARIVDRWQELEAMQSPPSLPDFNNPVAAARAWADAKESEQKALVQLEAAKPAVEFVESYTKADGLKGFREVCKLLKANEARFRDFLIDSRIMYRLGGKLMPFAQHLDAGRFSIITGVNGENAYTTAKFTAKGVAWVAGQWAADQLAKEVALK